MGFRIVEGPLSKKSSSVTAATNFTSTKHSEGSREVFNGNMEATKYSHIEYIFNTSLVDAYLLS